VYIPRIYSPAPDSANLSPLIRARSRRLDTRIHKPEVIHGDHDHKDRDEDDGDFLDVDFRFLVH
jgi:hypothetical protein